MPRRRRPTVSPPRADCSPWKALRERGRREATTGTSDKLNSTLRAFIERQPLFFVSTAAPDGRVNLSPNGLVTLRILDDRRIVWLNLTGSGDETAAHLRDITRMTLLLRAF